MCCFVVFQHPHIYLLSSVLLLKTVISLFLLLFSCAGALVVLVTLSGRFAALGLGSVLCITPTLTPQHSPSLYVCVLLPNIVNFRRVGHSCSFICLLTITCPCCIRCRQKEFAKTVDNLQPSRFLCDLQICLRACNKLRK